MSTVQTLKQHLKQHSALVIASAVILAVVLIAMFASRDSDESYSYSYEEMMGKGGAVAMDMMDDARVSYSTAESAQPEMMMEYDGEHMSVMPPYYGGEAAYDVDREREMVYTGSMAITVRSIEQTRTEVEELVEDKGGFVANEYFSEEVYYNNQGVREIGGYVGSMTLRVPNEEYDAVMSSLRDMALVVKRENSNVRDVTEQYYDLEARIDNKKEEEAQYQAIMDRADEVSDVLEVTRYLATVREEIERLEAQRNQLGNQVALSTIELEITSEDTVRLPGGSWNPGDSLSQSWHSLVQGVVALLDWLITLVVMLPLIILYGALALGLGYVVVRVGKYLYTRIR